MNYTSKKISKLNKIDTPYGTVIPLLQNKKQIDFAYGKSILYPHQQQSILHKYSDCVIVVIKGQFLLSINGHEDIVEDNSICTIPKKTPYTISNNTNENVEVLYLSFPLAPNPTQGHTYINNEGMVL